MWVCINLALESQTVGRAGAAASSLLYCEKANTTQHEVSSTAVQVKSGRPRSDGGKGVSRGVPVPATRTKLHPKRPRPEGRSHTARSSVRERKNRGRRGSGFAPLDGPLVAVIFRLPSALLFFQKHSAQEKHRIRSLRLLQHPEAHEEGSRKRDGWGGHTGLSPCSEVTSKQARWRKLADLREVGEFSPTGPMLSRTGRADTMGSSPLASPFFVVAGIEKSMPCKWFSSCFNL